MDIVRHTDPAAFQAAVGSLLTDDPIRHTGTLTRLAFQPRPDAVHLTAHDGGRLVGALLLPSPGVVLTSALPVVAHDRVISHLVENGITPKVVHGLTDVTDPFVERWCARTGAQVSDRTPERLHRLGTLLDPTVPGRARQASDGDIDLLARWYAEFIAEVVLPDTPQNPRATEALVRGALAAGSAYLIWEDGSGTPVSFASASPPVAGMSRIGPVYTPPGLRGSGFASATTAAAARWALDLGARDVLLFADVHNTTANSIYRALGFIPVLDSVETTVARPISL